MDVVLPEPDNTDSSETRWALETARTLWGQGERREALQWVRRAAEAASESGHDDRALLLAKQGAELRSSLDIPLTVPPPAPAAGASAPGTGSSPSLANIVPPGIPRPAAVPSLDGMPAAPAASAPTTKSALPPVTASPPAVASVVRPPSAPPASAGPARPASLFPSPSESDELVVTVVQSDGTVPTAAASLVSRRAVRVAVIAVDTPNELRVRKLAPGEVAPKDSTVALLVAFEPGAPPVPEGN